MMRKLIVSCFMMVAISAQAQIVFTKFKFVLTEMMVINDRPMGLKASYKVTSDKPIKKWSLRYVGINSVWEARSWNGHTLRGITDTGPFKPKHKYNWSALDVFARGDYTAFPHQINIVYMDNTIETIYIRKDNFKQYFPNNEWVDVNYFNVSIVEENPYIKEYGLNSDNPNPIVEQIPPVETTPDVDVNIPDLQQSNPNTYAVIIANESYQEVAAVDYAMNDGEVFKQYCHKVLGIPEENIHLRKNATKNNIIAEMSWMKDVSKAYNGKAKFIVFYAGHGIPDEKSNTAYLLPIDGIATNTETAYSLAKFYQDLNSMGAARVTLFMDACFSGAQRGDGMLASARGVAIKAKPQIPTGKMVVFSAAQGDETAYPYKEKKHGMFTYYLLKKLKESKGDCTYSELAEYIKTNVNQQSVVINRKSQTPTVTVSPTLGTGWKNLKMK